MENKEKELLEQLKQKTADMKVPEKLSPQNIEAQLKQVKSKKERPRYYVWGSAVAACLVLVSAFAIIRTSFQRNMPQMEMAAASPELAELRMAEDYSEIYDYLENAWRSYETETTAHFDTFGIMEARETSADMAMSVEEAGSADFSDTNIREIGVGESDYVKTDGRYLYLRKDDRETIEIVDTKGREMTAIGSIEVEEGITVLEFYIQEDVLLMLCNKVNTESNKELVDPGFGGPGFAGSMYDVASTLLITYDISDPEKPKQIGEVMQSGDYYTSRVVDGYVYIFSQYYAKMGAAREEIEAYIPRIGGKEIAEQKIVMPFMPMGEKYMVIASVKIDNPTEIVDSRAVFNQGGQCYVSAENIYIYQYQHKWAWGEEWKSNVDGMTNIQKIGYKDGRFEAKAQNTIYGYLESSFSIDEYDDHLRTVTTVQKGDTQSNAVYVMNRNMEITGKIEGLAKEERVYSARLMGEIGYFVTFRETDPLFSVDFSDPKNPTIIGALKIPGFSEYLHPYNDHLLLGIGMEVDEHTQVSGGVKISMFDISDPTQVKEIDKKVLEGVYSADVFYDYKAALIVPEKDIVGFSADTHRGETYHIFGYEEGVGFEMKLDTQVNGTSYVTTRGLYIDDILYVVKGNIVESYSLEDYQKIDDIIL